MTQYKLICNPAAGHGFGEQAIPKIERLFEQHNLEFELTRTTGFWHAVELAKEAALKGFDVIVAAGGDGTVNEVINGLMEAKLAGAGPFSLGVLCIGRGNDFAYGMDIPTNFENGFNTLLHGYQRTIDVGRVYGGRHPEGRYFGNCVGVGFDAIGTIEVQKFPRLGGFWSYLIAVLRTIILYHNAPESTIRFDDQVISQSSLMISIMNGKRLGGGFYPAPDADPGDGYLDLCIVQQVSRPRTLALLPYFLKGTQSTQKEVQNSRAMQISITSHGGPLPAQTDGEILCTDGLYLEVELLPQQLNLICNPPGESA